MGNVISADRYNALGQWRPLIYEGAHQPIYDSITPLSNDDEVLGCLLYIRVTGKLVVEFVVRTSVELPDQPTSLTENLHLWRCPSVKEPGKPAGNIHVYDGWFILKTDQPNEINSAIQEIANTLNRIAFAFSSSVDWRLKYRFANNGSGYATPTSNDMLYFKTMLARLPNEDDNQIINAAVDWYNRGSSTRNVFAAYLCQYIALESIAIAVAEGDANFNLGIPHKTKEEQRQERRDCIKLLHDRLYANEPLDFVFKAYFECFVTLKRSVMLITEAIFGSRHPYIVWLFDKSEGPSLADIRSELAHGRFTLANKVDEELVRTRLPQLTEVVSQFIIQLIQRSTLGVSHGGAQWSGQHAYEMSPFDPRIYLLASSESSLPKTDWLIRPEWCE